VQGQRSSHPDELLTALGEAPAPPQGVFSGTETSKSPRVADRGQIRDLERELAFTLFEGLPRGLKLSAAGKLFLSDARRLLQEVQGAKLRAERVATGKAGTLCVGFVEAL
jgi:hypothetical protein